MMNFPIGRAIRDAREARGISKYRLERLSHVGGGYLTRVEECEQSPSLDRLQCIAKVLRMELWELVKSAQELQKRPLKSECERMADKNRVSQ